MLSCCQHSTFQHEKTVAELQWKTDTSTCGLYPHKPIEQKALRFALGQAGDKGPRWTLQSPSRQPRKKKKKRQHSGWSTVRGLTRIIKLNWGSQETWESALVMLPTTFSALFKATQHLNLSQVSKPLTGKSSRNVPATLSSWYWINGAPDAQSAVLRIGSHLWSWTIHLILVSKCLYVRNTFSSCSYMIRAYVHRSPGLKSQVSSSLGKNFSSSYRVPSTVLALGFPG